MRNGKLEEEKENNYKLHMMGQSESRPMMFFMRLKCCYTSHQNEFVIKKNRIFLHMVNAMIMNPKFALNLVSDTLLTACYVYNRITFRKHMYLFTNYGMKKT